MDRALIRAHGHALCLMASVMQRADIISAQEFGELLGMYAVIVGEEEEDAGHALAIWGGMIRDAAEVQG